VLSTVDPLPGLQGKTMTGGRLDAAAALGAATPVNGEAPFIQHLYSDVLGRTASDGEIRSWVSSMNAGVSRAQVVRSFWESQEHRVREVDSYYAQYLHRSADSAEEFGWVQAFQHGLSEADVILGFVTSGEYTAAHADALSFVNGLYQDMLGRVADAAGEASWTALLATTGSRAMVANSILRSTEFYRGTVDAYYTQFLYRAAGSGEEQGWVTGMTQGSVSIETAAIGFLNSSEYYSRP
jgi:hypothetical protein